VTRGPYAPYREVARRCPPRQANPPPVAGGLVQVSGGSGGPGSGPCRPRQRYAGTASSIPARLGGVPPCGHPRCIWDVTCETGHSPAARCLARPPGAGSAGLTTCHAPTEGSPSLITRNGLLTCGSGWPDLNRRPLRPERWRGPRVTPLVLSASCNFTYHGAPASARAIHTSDARLTPERAALRALSNARHQISTA
jgi:hypothetical protein